MVRNHDETHRDRTVRSNQGRLRLLLLLAIRMCVALLAICLVADAAFATEDDVVVEAADVVLDASAQQVFQINAKVRIVALQAAALNDRTSDFDLQVFGLDRTEQRGRWKLNTEADLAITYLDRICSLTDHQREKLMLAERADRQRFFERMDAARTKWHGAEQNSQGYQAEIKDLQRKATLGLLDDSSFFAKAVRKNLTEEQLMQLDANRRATHQNLAKKLLETLVLTEKLDKSQREKLIELIVTISPMPLDFGHSDELIQKKTELNSLENLFPSPHLKVMKYHLALQSMQRVRPLLRPVQWQEVRPQFIEFRRFEQELLSLKVITPPDDYFERVPVPQEPK